MTVSVDVETADLYWAEGIADAEALRERSQHLVRNSWAVEYLAETAECPTTSHVMSGEKMLDTYPAPLIQSSKAVRTTSPLVGIVLTPLWSGLR